MKRYNNLFEKICTLDNLFLADKKARKGKTKTKEVIKFDIDKDNKIELLHKILVNGEYTTSQYHTFKIYEPKERLVYKLPYFPDRIVHHAIMNILEPIWVKTFTTDTYSCIKNRGIHKLSYKLRYDLKKDVVGTKYCLKMDITKFYPSINHDILKQIIRKKIKDKQVLILLDEIIDSSDGLPIGNYLSQYLSNLYLTYFDHWVKESLKIKYYYRYADDIVIFSDNKEYLKNIFIKIEKYLRINLDLKINPKWQIYPIDKRGVDFIGYVFYHTHVKIRKRIKKNLFRQIIKYKKDDFKEFKQNFSSYHGWLSHCDSKNLIKKLKIIINESKLK